MNGLPRLYDKYVGHDDNRDFYMSNMPETTNMNRQLFIEWFPQIMYNHHQTGPAGAVIFMPPFRDPFNYNFDPLVPLGIEMVGTAMHSRLVAEGKGGSAMRTGANYSTWWNGGLRTVTYFHNMIGILTEIIGSPTPMRHSAGGRQAACRRAIGPCRSRRRTWHYRQSIDYEMTNNRAMLDLRLALSRNLALQHLAHGDELDREGQQGSLDHHAEAHRRAGSGGSGASRRRTRRTGRTGGGSAGRRRLAAAAASRLTRAVPAELYDTVLHDPKLRDPRGYIIPSDQPDFATATEFVNALLKNGITVMQAPPPRSPWPARAIPRDRTW